MPLVIKEIAVQAMVGNITYNLYKIYVLVNHTNKEYCISAYAHSVEMLAFCYEFRVYAYFSASETVNVLIIWTRNWFLQI